MEQAIREALSEALGVPIEQIQAPWVVEDVRFSW